MLLEKQTIYVRIHLQNKLQYNLQCLYRANKTSKEKRGINAVLGKSIPRNQKRKCLNLKWEIKTSLENSFCQNKTKKYQGPRKSKPKKPTQYRSCVRKV